MPRHCKSIPHEQVQFRAILVATNPTRYHHLSRKVATCRDMSRLQYKKKSHTHWNCRNSIAVMFDLRCSKFELFCSELAGQPVNHLVREPYFKSFRCAKSSISHAQREPNTLPVFRQLRWLLKVC